MEKNWLGVNAEGLEEGLKTGLSMRELLREDWKWKILWNTSMNYKSYLFEFIWETSVKTGVFFF